MGREGGRDDSPEEHEIQRLGQEVGRACRSGDIIEPLVKLQLKLIAVAWVYIGDKTGQLRRA